MMEQGDLLLTQLQYKTTLKYFMKPRHVDDEVLSKRMEKSTHAKYQRSTTDSENWEPPKSTCSSTRSTTESIIKSFQSRVKTNDSGRWEHRIMWITLDGTQNEVHSMFIILERWHRLLHVRALLA